jgi:hypothetical protein
MVMVVGGVVTGLVTVVETVEAWGVAAQNSSR